MSCRKNGHTLFLLNYKVNVLTLRVPSFSHILSVSQSTTFQGGLALYEVSIPNNSMNAVRDE